MKKSTIKSIVQGIILFAVFLTYQKLGVGYFLALIVYEVSNKNIKTLFIELFTAFILLLIFLGILQLQNNLTNFIDFAVLGIGEFGNKNSIAKDIKAIMLLLTPVLTIIAYIITLKNIKRTKLNKSININSIKPIIIFAIFSYLCIIPLINTYHVVLANILTYICLGYLLNFLIAPIIEELKLNKVVSILIIGLSILMIIKSMLNIYFYSIRMYKENNNLYGAILEEEDREMLKEVDNYISNTDKNVIIFSTYSPMISIYRNDLDNGKYDLVLRGNLGLSGEQGLIEEIKQMKNTQILLLHETDDEKELYQFVYEATEYIKENLNFVGQINKFDIYETIN